MLQTRAVDDDGENETKKKQNSVYIFSFVRQTNGTAFFSLAFVLFDMVFTSFFAVIDFAHFSWK